MGAQPRVSNRDLIAAYEDLGSVHKVGERFGIHGSSVHERLVKLGAAKSMNTFTDAERERLRVEYRIYRDAGRLGELAESMGRTKQFLSRKAGEMGLTDRNAPRLTARVWKGMSEEAAEVIWEDFKRSSLGLGAYCAKKGYDDLGFSKTMREHFGDEWEHVIESKAPRQSKYRLGRALEYRCRDRLKALGYFALRSPASRSPIDILAIRPGLVLFVQCKRGGTLPVSEWNALMDAAESCGALPVMCEQPSGRGSMRWWLLNERKDGSKRRQPLSPFDPESGGAS